MATITNQTPDSELDDNLKELDMPADDKPEDDKPLEDAPADDKPEDDRPPVDIPPQEDFKKRFAESTREAQILYAKNKKTMETIQEAGKVAEPTEDEMKVQFPDWDLMSDTEKSLSKRVYKGEKALGMITQISEESKKVDEWNGKVDTFVDDPESAQKYPKLAGREAEFKAFASKPTRVGVDFEVLVNAFSYELNTGGGHKTLFNNGSGGDKPQSTTPTAEDASTLRKTNPREWERRSKAGYYDKVIQ
jgi:hypothetical protein